MSRRALVFLGLTVFALVLSFRIRFRAWPEVLVPSYLCGRGWVLYRDVKVVHSPLLIGALAGLSRGIGFGAVSLRIAGFVPVIAVLFALAGHARERKWGTPAQVAAGLFFILAFDAWDGNAIYPEVFLAALAIPIYAALRRGQERDFRRAGWLFGLALSIKQPAFPAFLFACAWIFFRRRERLLSFLVRAAAVPAACFLAFAAAGAAGDFARWTLEVPLLYYRGRTTLGIQPNQVGTVVAVALPLLAWISIVLARGRERGDSILLGGLIATFALLAFPHFELVHLVAAVPLLAVVTGEAIAPLRNSEGRGGSARGSPWALYAAQATVCLSILLCGAYLATDSSAGEMSFWSSKQDDAVVGRLAALPPAPLFLYGLDQNLFIRSGRVPPGDLYSNPDLWIHFLVDGLEGREVHILRDHPETIVLRGSQSPIETPARLLPRFLAAHYESREFVRPVELLRPLAAQGVP